MTADGFTQMKSGNWILSPLFESCDIPLGVIDEAHQLDPNIIGAISCWVKELLIYFDEAQAINESSATMFRHQNTGGFSRQFAESNTTYNWERAAGHDDKPKTTYGIG